MRNEDERCGLCYDSEQGTHGKVEKYWSEDYGMYVPLCTKHTPKGEGGDPPSPTVTEAVTLLGTRRVAEVLASDDPLKAIERAVNGAESAVLAQAYRVLTRCVMA